MTDTRQSGWLMLGPGVYMDESTGEMHFYAEDFLVALGTLVTPENIVAAERIMREVCREQYGSIPIIKVTDER